MKWLIGIDEAGRGPLAGPVAVGVVAVPIDFNWMILPGVGDSKRLSPKVRENLFEGAQKLQREKLIKFSVMQSSAEMIDKKGIVFAIRSAMDRALSKLELDPSECEVRLDGALRAPSTYLKQTTIIGGDGSETVIGLASIMAKVTRDRHMLKLAKREPLSPYQLDIHKGYGTKLHRELIKKHGLSDIHRRSFCRNCLI